MRFSTAHVDDHELETIIAEFENQWSEKMDVRLVDFLPPESHPDFARVLEELVRIDIEIRWSKGTPNHLDVYLGQFPDTLRQPAVLQNIALEDFRIRNQAGQPVAAQDYADKYQVDISAWPQFHAGATTTSEVPKHDWNPKIGETICGFRILDRLGSGVSGAVFIAQQTTLSDRLVAVKVSLRTAEPEILAQLQHTNIVPIFSVEREKHRQVFCMPLLGVLTLAEVVEQNQHVHDPSITLQQLISTVAAERAETLSEFAFHKHDADESLATISPGVHLHPRLGMLTGRSAVATWVWFFSKIAEGLAHAHQNNIVHRDLKPANILIADNGQPLILDFHLSTSATGLGKELVGGTLPYMSPEQLNSLQTGKSIDARSDIFSFGVMLFQAISGRFPFENRLGDMESVVRQMLRDRERGPHPVSDSVQVRPSLQTIIEQCLAFDPEDRYRETDHLLVDLRCWLAHQPLLHAPNRSLNERMRNWSIRHPKITSATSIGLISIVLVLFAVIGYWQRGKQIARHDAMDWSRNYILDVENQIPPLALPAQDFETSFQQIRQAVKSVLGPAPDPAHQIVDSATFRLLEPDQQAKSQRASEHLEYWIRDAVERLRSRADHEELDELNELVTQLGSESESSNPPSFLTEFLSAAELYQSGSFENASAILTRLSVEKPDKPFVWLLAGNVFQSLGKLPEAEACFSVCIGLVESPDWAYAQRGLLRYLQEDYRAAIGDFNEALEVDDSIPPYYLNRGICYKAIGDAQRAELDFSRALELGASETRVYFLRSSVRNVLGDRAGAMKDYQTGLSLEPNDELSWIARGVRRLSHSPDDALHDFEQALVINPRSRVALQDIAHVYSEIKADNPAAIETMERLIANDPNDAGAQATIGVLLARNGDTLKATAAASRALALSDESSTQYSVAGIYALLSENRPEFVGLAVDLLRRAAIQSPQTVAADMKTDPDLKRIEKSPEFVQFRKHLTQLLMKRADSD